MTLLERLTPLFREIFRDPTLEVTPELRATDVPAWDSLNHINLVVAIENEFQVEFTTEQLGSMGKVGDLLDILERPAANGPRSP